MSSTGQASALDAGVSVDPRAERKARAAVAYYEREVDAAADAVQRLQGKRDKLTAQARQAGEDLKAAKAELKTAGERLATAKAALEGDS